MAMIDYGAIAFKNGKLISTDMFTPMIDMVGWEDTENDVYHDYDNDTSTPLKLNGNYFAYIGDKDCTVAFYKCQMVIAEKYNDGDFRYHHEYFNCTNYTWSKWEDYAGEGLAKIKVTKRNGYFVCKWTYRDDNYKVYFGYGVDFDYYKKYHIVNYYRSPEFNLYRCKRWIKDKIYDWKYLR
jgi:hypothetical protein